MTKSRKDIKGAGCKKVVIIGDDGIGKTSLLYRMIEKKQLETSIDLLSSFTHTTKVVVRTKSRKKINLDLWDTLSTEEYDRLRPLTYPKIRVSRITIFFKHVNVILQKFFLLYQCRTDFDYDRRSDSSLLKFAGSFFREHQEKMAGGSTTLLPTKTTSSCRYENRSRSNCYKTSSRKFL